MSGDPTLCHLEKVFCEFQGEQTLMESRINVLCSMMSAMSEHMAEGSALVVDYSELNVEKIFMLSEHFRLTLTAEACARVRERSLFDTKASSQHFHDDVTKKHREYTPAEQDKIRKALWGGYQTLLAGRNQMGVKKRVE